MMYIHNNGLGKGKNPKTTLDGDDIEGKIHLFNNLLRYSMHKQQIP